MEPFETFSRSYDASIERLYQASGGARFAISKPEFSAALHRSCERRFAGARVHEDELRQYLEELHVADLALALACRAGNEDAWRQFHDNYHATAERYARGLVRDPERAEELADTLWGDLYGLAGGPRGRTSPLDHYHGRSALGPWLRAVMVRRNADAWRQAGRVAGVERSAIRASAAIDGALEYPPDPDRAHYLAILADVLSRVLDQLEPRDQRRLSHYYVKGLPLEEVSALMREHESTVSRSLLRTRREIRRQVDRRLRRDHRLTDDQISKCFEYATDDWPLDLAGAFIGELRRKGLDVVLVIDCAGSMKVIVRDIRAKMTELVQAIHRMVPSARVGLVLFAGKHEVRQVQPLTPSPRRAQEFLDNLVARDGGPWAGDTFGACQHAVANMPWRSPAKKVIVLVGDSPPAKEEWEPFLRLIRDFRVRNGTFNTIDVAAEEHERFEREFWIKLHGEQPPSISPVAEFYQQAEAAYKALAEAGGGTMRSLTKAHNINYQLLILAFGEQWRNQVAAFAREIEGGNPQAPGPTANSITDKT